MQGMRAADAGAAAGRNATETLQTPSLPYTRTRTHARTTTTTKDTEQCDIVTLHCPLLPSTYHVIDAPRVASLKHGAMLINVSRGGLIDSDAVLEGLERGAIGALVRAACRAFAFSWAGRGRRRLMSTPKNPKQPTTHEPTTHPPTHNPPTHNPTNPSTTTTGHRRVRERAERVLRGLDNVGAGGGDEALGPPAEAADLFPAGARRAARRGAARRDARFTLHRESGRRHLTPPPPPPFLPAPRRCWCRPTRPS